MTYISGTPIQFLRGNAWYPATYISTDKQFTKIYSQFGMELIHSSKVKLR